MPTYVRTHCDTCPKVLRAPQEVKDDGMAEAYQHQTADQHMRKYPDHQAYVRHDVMSEQLAEHYVKQAYF